MRYPGCVATSLPATGFPDNDSTARQHKSTGASGPGTVLHVTLIKSFLAPFSLAHIRVVDPVGLLSLLRIILFLSGFSNLSFTFMFKANWFAGQAKLQPCCFLSWHGRSLFSGEDLEVWTSKKYQVTYLQPSVKYQTSLDKTLCSCFCQVVVNDPPATQGVLMYLFLPRFSIGKLLSAVLRHF